MSSKYLLKFYETFNSLVDETESMYIKKSNIFGYSGKPEDYPEELVNRMKTYYWESEVGLYFQFNEKTYCIEKVNKKHSVKVIRDYLDQLNLCKNTSISKNETLTDSDVEVLMGYLPKQVELDKIMSDISVSLSEKLKLKQEKDGELSTDPMAHFDVVMEVAKQLKDSISDEDTSALLDQLGGQDQLQKIFGMLGKTKKTL